MSDPGAPRLYPAHWTVFRLIRSEYGMATARATGGLAPCRAIGCRGRRVAVRWGDGTLAFPCTTDLEPTAVSDEWTYRPSDRHGPRRPARERRTRS